jgi:transcriptional regulator with XRE-family HTH domain
MLRSRVRLYLSFVGENVRRRRKRREQTQEQLAEAAGLDVRFIRRVERGSVNLRFDTVVRLAEALDVEPGALLRKVKVAAAKPGRPRKKRAP